MYFHHCGLGAITTPPKPWLVFQLPRTYMFSMMRVFLNCGDRQETGNCRLSWILGACFTWQDPLEARLKHWRGSGWSIYHLFSWYPITLGLQPPRPTTYEVGSPLSVRCLAMLLVQTLNGFLAYTIPGDSTTRNYLKLSDGWSINTIIFECSLSPGSFKIVKPFMLVHLSLAIASLLSASTAKNQPLSVLARSSMMVDFFQCLGIVGWMTGVWV